MVVLKVVKLLLDHGASPDSGYASPSGHNNRPCFTPNLFLAVMMPESFDLVKLLLERGANQHQPYSRDRGSLGINAESISGFETAISDSLVANLVGRAVSQIDSSIETDIIPKLELLIQHGGNIDSQIEGLTLLQYCLRQNSWRAQKSIQLIPHLLIHGAELVKFSYQKLDFFYGSLGCESCLRSPSSMFEIRLILTSQTALESEAFFQTFDSFPY